MRPDKKRGGGNGLLVGGLVIPNTLNMKRHEVLVITKPQYLFVNRFRYPASYEVTYLVAAMELWDLDVFFIAFETC